MIKTSYVNEIIQSTQIESIENDGPYYDAVLDVNTDYDGKYSKREIIRKSFNRVEWEELIDHRYFVYQDNEEPLPEEIEHVKVMIGELYDKCSNEELKRLILYSADLIKERKEYELRSTALRKKYHIGLIEQEYLRRDK